VTELTFRQSWQRLARAVLERSFEDLEEGSQGFGSAPHWEKVKWKRDAEVFFERLWYRAYSEAAGYTDEDIEAAFKGRGHEDGRIRGDRRRKVESGGRRQGQTLQGCTRTGPIRHFRLAGHEQARIASPPNYPE
jgi:hypothetical protein